MTIARSVITVDPGGRAMIIDIQTMAGVSVTTYDAADGGSARVTPLSISSTTSFYLTTPGDYQVSALVNGRQIAGSNGNKQAVTVPLVGEIRVVPIVDAGETLDIGEVVGSTELGYAEVTANDTTTNTSYASSISNKIAGLSVTVVGQGLPVYIEFFCPGAVHSTTASGPVNVTLVINGALTSGQLATVSSPSTSTSRALTMRRRMILTSGTSCTFEIGKYVTGAGTGTYTAVADAPMHLAVTR